jgi:hypothetical protein
MIIVPNELRSKLRTFIDKQTLDTLDEFFDFCRNSILQNQHGIAEDVPLRWNQGKVQNLLELKDILRYTVEDKKSK